MFRKVVLGSGLVALVPTVQAAQVVPPVVEAKSGPAPPPVMRPSDLPIYETPHADYGEYVEKTAAKKKKSAVYTSIEEPVRSVRESVQSVLSQTESVQKSIRDNISEFQDRTDWIVKYLREEENKQIRYGAVGMGGLTGFIFGLRGGIIRRVLYAGVGTTLMGAVCFPEETKEVVNKNSAVAKQYMNIAYNFFYGVKPGDPQLELKFPELSVPQNFNEFVDLTVSVASSIKQAVMPPPSKEAVAEKKE